jgi:uncharacterized membrane protein
MSTILPTEQQSDSFVPRLSAFGTFMLSFGLFATIINVCTTLHYLKTTMTTAGEEVTIKNADLLTISLVQRSFHYQSSSVHRQPFQHSLHCQNSEDHRQQQ